MKYKAKNMAKCMLKLVRISAGLGNPPHTVRDKQSRMCQQFTEVGNIDENERSRICQ